MRPVKFIQPALVHKLVEEYQVTDGPASKIPAVTRQVLVKGNNSGAIVKAQAKMNQLVMATCMYMM